MKWYQKLNPIWWFKNDDPVAPDWYEKTWPLRKRQFYWMYLRNPLHNFTNYIIGIRDIEDKTQLGIAPGEVFKTGGGLNLTWFFYIPDRLQSIILALLLANTLWYGSIIWALIFVVFLFRPFISWQGKFKFYIGWREKGAFGFKLTNLK